ncbi:hypothetical protein BLOT_016063 [Blomia tropicalis]|nr:hypothetical protein BLOT_016063 [Blomia tropicalis]
MQMGGAPVAKPNLDLPMMFKKIVQNDNILNDYNFYQQRIQFEVAPISTNAENRMDYLGGKSMSQTTILTTMMTRKQTSKTQQQQQQQQQPTDAKPASSSTPQISPKDDQKLLDDETESDTSEEEWINNKLAKSIKVPQFNKEDPEVWFKQVKAAIFVGQVRKEKEQYMHVLANLSAEAMTSVRDLVGKQYCTEDYKRLKNNLIKRFSLTPTEKIRMVLDKIEQRSSERPSAFFRRL